MAAMSASIAESRSGVHGRLVQKGVQVHVGEWGVFKKTPHQVALAWMEDSLSLWKDAGWGYSLWNLRGDFGVLESGRDDVAYEDYKGHKLDRQMLELLRRY
jgi:endoglucanase